jgi:CRISPR/Cas system-associated exonuclease Cas4 (RecB family)
MAGIAKRFFAWSWSRLQTYELCPAKAKYGYLDKIEEPKNPSMLRGSAIHKMAENYVNKGGTLKAELKLYERLFKEVRDLKKKKGVEIYTELQNALTSRWTLTTWFAERGAPKSEEPWVRVIVDLAIVDTIARRARFIDHKTGKVNLDGAVQLELYAIWGFIKFPEVDEIDGELWFLDQLISSRHVVTFYRKDLQKLITKWTKRSMPLLKDTAFRPKPNDKCRWCYYSKAKDGPCKY